MIKLSVVQFLVDHGVPDIFLSSGGGITHLTESVGRNSGMTCRFAHLTECSNHVRSKTCHRSSRARKFGRTCTSSTMYKCARLCAAG